MGGMLGMLLPRGKALDDEVDAIASSIMRSRVVDALVEKIIERLVKRLATEFELDVDA